MPSALTSSGVAFEYPFERADPCTEIIPVPRTSTTNHGRSPMSRPSTDIFFGVFLGSEGAWLNDEDYTELSEDLGEFDDMIAAANGLAEPAGEYDETRYGAYLDKRKPLIEACPVHLIQSGHDFSDVAIALKATLISTDWDDNPLTLTAHDRKLVGEGQEIQAVWAEEVKAWCEKLGLPWDKIEKANPEGPRWMITTGYS
jgi:hypothetical protein